MPSLIVNSCRPLLSESGKNNTKLIKSRKGHRVIFDDKDGEEKLIVVDRTKKNKIVMDTVKNLIQIECDGDSEIKAKENIVLYSDSLKLTSSEASTLIATRLPMWTCSAS